MPNKIVFCSGKVFFDIQQKLSDHHQIKGGCIVIRVEELAPFPVKLIKEELQKHNALKADVVWVQEECMNEGAFQFAKLHIDRLLKDLNFTKKSMEYVGRPSQHSFATGSPQDYKKEGEKLWKDFEKAVLN